MLTPIVLLVVTGFGVSILFCWRSFTAEKELQKKLKSTEARGRRGAVFARDFGKNRIRSTISRLNDRLSRWRPSTNSKSPWQHQQKEIEEANEQKTSRTIYNNKRLRQVIEDESANQETFRQFKQDTFLSQGSVATIRMPGVPRISDIWQMEKSINHRQQIPLEREEQQLSDHNDLNDSSYNRRVGSFVFALGIPARMLVEQSMKITNSTVYQASVVFLLFLFYPAITATTFEIFKCHDEEINGVKLLLTDMTVQCDTPEHKLAKAIAAVMIFVYALGIPAMGLIVILRHRGSLNHPSFKKVYGFLYDGYRDECIWWEAVVLLRKLGTTFLSVFVNDSFNQIYFASWLIFIAIIAHLLFRPFEDWRLNRLEAISLFATYVTQAGSIMYSSLDQNSNISTSQDRSITISLIVANVLALGFFLVSFMSGDEISVAKDHIVDRFLSFRQKVRKTTPNRFGTAKIDPGASMLINTSGPISASMRPSSHINNKIHPRVLKSSLKPGRQELNREQSLVQEPRFITESSTIRSDILYKVSMPIVHETENKHQGENEEKEGEEVTREDFKKEESVSQPGINSPKTGFV